MAEVHEAVARGDREEVRRLLASDPDCVNWRFDENGDQPLHIAAYQDDAEMVRLLLDHGAAVDGCGKGSQTPLHSAARQGSVSAASMLIERGADLDARDDTNFTPAFYAARSREQEGLKIAEMLIAAGAHVDLNLAVCLGDQTRVERCLSEDPDAVKNSPFPNDLVLDAVTNIQCRIWDQLSPANTKPDANLAVMKANDGILRLVLSHGAAIDNPRFGWSPLFDSCQMHHPYITELLLEHGADPNVRYEGGGLKGMLRIPGGGEAMLAVLTKYGFKSGK